MNNTRGEELEILLTKAFLSLRDAEHLTKEKIDIPFLLNIVGSYITAKENDKLDEGVLPPGQVFEERIFPLVDNSTLEVEEIIEAEVIEDE